MFTDCCFDQKLSHLNRPCLVIPEHAVKKNFKYQKSWTSNGGDKTWVDLKKKRKKKGNKLYNHFSHMAFHRSKRGESSTGLERVCPAPFEGGGTEFNPAYYTHY